MSYYRGVPQDFDNLARQRFRQMPLADACELAGIGRRTARRAIARGELKPVGSAKSRRGKPAHVVWLYDVLQLKTAPDSRPAWARFQAACQKRGHDPKLALALMVSGSDYDPDLLHAGIRLTLHGWQFLDVLFGLAAPDGSFDSFVASKMRKPLPTSVKLGLKEQSFRVQWQNAQRGVARWTANTTPVLVAYASGEAPRLVEYPLYQQGFSGRFSDWSGESVRSAGRKLRGQYQRILRKLQDALWEMRGPTERPLDKDKMQRFGMATEMVKGANPSDVRLAVSEAAGELVQLGIPPNHARSFLRAWVAQKQSKGRLSAAAVARVFCKTECRPET